MALMASIPQHEPTSDIELMRTTLGEALTIREGDLVERLENADDEGIGFLRDMWGEGMYRNLAGSMEAMAECVMVPRAALIQIVMGSSSRLGSGFETWARGLGGEVDELSLS